MRARVASDIRSIFNCPDLPSAHERLKHFVSSYSKSAPKLATWMEENLHQGFNVFSFPDAHQRRLRTSNALERINLELKRRTRVASLFPNEASLLRLISALLCEISQEWHTSKIYINMNPSDLHQI
jgi:transposase-like protein